jgi:hypothetical protein
MSDPDAAEPFWILVTRPLPDLAACEPYQHQVLSACYPAVEAFLSKYC